jgi:site-specific DNA-methyltransferase (adenine-specific)
VNKVHFSSQTDLWATPQELFDKLNIEFQFNLDPCATEDNAKCKKFFSKDIDGLIQDWGKARVFMNPPYGREIGKWVEKASVCNAEIVVGLLPARTDTKWFHEFIYNKAEVRFIKGRLKFGDAKNGAPFPSMIVIWRKQEVNA